MKQEEYLKVLSKFVTWREASDAQRNYFLSAHANFEGLLSAATKNHEVAFLWAGYVTGWVAREELNCE